MTKLESDLIDSLKYSFEGVPKGYLESEADGWEVVAARFVTRMTTHGIYFKSAEDHDKATVVKRSTDGRSRRPALCQEVLLGVGQCVKVAGHRGQHQLQTGDNFG